MEVCGISGQFSSTRIRFGSQLRSPFFNVTQSPALCVHFDSWVDSGCDKPSDPGNRMFILGMGYVGRFFAQQLKAEGWVVSGTCRSHQKKKELEDMGLTVHLFDAVEPECRVLDTCKSFTHLLVSMPPTGDISDPVHQHEEILRNRLADGNLQWLCYLSSTSVYGNHEGAWVDENGTPNPSTKAAKARLEAEEYWLNLAHNLRIPGYVFRLAGIYGPGRSAVDTILKQNPLSDSQKRRVSKQFTSRVHVLDICQALRACISVRPSRKIYNIVDDDPACRAQVFAFARLLIEEKWPGVVGSTDFLYSSEEAQSGGKRVSNFSMKEELGVKLLHASYTSGLKDIIDLK